MKIFLLSSVVPFRSHGESGVTAGGIVMSSVLQEFLRMGHELIFQHIVHPTRRDGGFSPAEEREMDALKSQGATVLPSLNIPAGADAPVRWRTLKLLLNSQMRREHFAQAVRLNDEVRGRVASVQPDVILTLWSSEGIAASDDIKNVPRVAYHGDIDYLPHLCQLRDRSLFRKNTTRVGLRTMLNLLDQYVRIFLFRSVHLALMRKLDAIANIDAGNASFYTTNGHPHSIYARSTWIAPKRPEITIPIARDGRKVKIIGHASYLDRTGSTYGLRFLLDEVLPSLRQELNDVPHEVHVIGGGQPVPSLRRLLEQSGVILRGFVPDFDAELKSSDVFCILNNAGPYHSTYTRHFVAWSMGLCLIAHEGSRAAIPEIRDGENALLGSTGPEVASAIARAVRDPALNRRIREGGLRTFMESFTPDIVAQRIVGILEEAILHHRH